MAHTDLYRKQHKEILDIAARIRPLLDTKTLAVEGTQANNLSGQLAGKLRVHLTVEEKGLFPQLIAHPIADVRTKAQQYQGELGNLLKAFNDFTTRYPSPAAIQQAPAGFAKDAGQFLDLLSARLNVEENDLYTLVDRSY